MFTHHGWRLLFQPVWSRKASRFMREVSHGHVWGRACWAKRRDVQRPPGRNIFGCLRTSEKAGITGVQ